MTFTVALMIAVSYWGARDVQLPCHPEPVRVSNEQLVELYGPDAVRDVYMYADAQDCQIGVSELAAADRYWMPSYYCLGIVHEVRHIEETRAGVPEDQQHTATGVMADNGGHHIPWACTHPRRFLRRWRHEHKTTTARREAGRRGTEAASAAKATRAPR